MNDKMLPSCQKRKIVYETMDHYWVRNPYKFRSGPDNPNVPHGEFVHKDIEMNLVTQGELDLTLDGRSFTVKTGELFCVNQYTSHALNFNSDTRYFLLIISTKFLNEHNIDVSKLTFDEIISDRKIVDFFEEIKTASLSPDRFNKTSVQGSILRLVAYVASNYSQEKPQIERESDLASFSLEFQYTKQAIDYITANLRNELTLDHISTALGISKYHFSRIFNKITGYTLSDYICKVRCEHAKYLLSGGEISVKEAAISSGFNNVSYFAKSFKKHIGYLPSKLLSKDSK